MDQNQELYAFMSQSTADITAISLVLSEIIASGAKATTNPSEHINSLKKKYFSL